MQTIWVRTLPGLMAAGSLLLGMAAAGETVAVRLNKGRFLQVKTDGTVRAERFFPDKEEMFELVARGERQIGLKAANGRYLVRQDMLGRTLWAASTASEPGEWETLTLVPVDGNRVAIKTTGAGGFVVFDRSAAPAPATAAPDQPCDAQTVELCRVTELPESLRSTLSSLIGGLIAQELKDKEYNKTRTRKKERFLELPAPTFRDLQRKKPRRLLSLTEQYQITARLDGTPQITIGRMVFLDGYLQPGSGRLLFTLEATLLVQGRVRYQIPDLMSASTGFRATVNLWAVGEVAAKKSSGKSPLSAPELVSLEIQVRRLDLSNDLLNLGRALIEDLVNHELRDNEPRIRQKANDAIRKAMEAHPIRLPLLKYLGFPLG